MEPKVVDLGSSLLVPSVQELANKSITTVPSSYIRPKQEKPVVFDAGFMFEIPIIDIEALVSKESTVAELGKLDFACKEWGFFQLINHQVSSSLVEKVKTKIQDFFNLPMEEKKMYLQTLEDLEGYGQSQWQNQD